MYKLIRTLLPVLAAMIATTVSAQSVSWKSSVQHLDGQTYRIVLEASIPAPWHMYDMGPYEGGPNATTITFTPGEGAVLEGGVEPADPSRTPLRQNVRNGDRNLRPKGAVRPERETHGPAGDRQSGTRMDDLQRYELPAARRHGTDDHPARRCDARRAARGNSGQGERRGTGNRPCGRNRSRHRRTPQAAARCGG